MILNSKNYFIFFLILVIFLNNQHKVKLSSVTIGTAIVPNQCSTLGSNNPLRLLDCSIFQLPSGMCCLLTITTTDEETDDDGVTSMVEHYKSACIILPKINAKIIILSFVYFSLVSVNTNLKYFL